MPRRRPTVVTVFAILNIVFGSIGILGVLCGGVGIIALSALFSSIPQQQGGQPVPFPPIVVTATGVLLGIDFILVLMLLSSGIGLLGMRPWARRLSIAYAVCRIVMAIVGMVIQIAVTQPAMEQWQRDVGRQMGQAPGAGMAGPPMPASNPIGGAATSVFGAVFGSAYAVALLVVMFMPRVADALEGRPSRRPEDLDEFEDEDVPRDRDRDRDEDRDRPWGERDTGIREP